ncbi:hypothetical protein KSS87_002994 [Heliosperma pusillum]|nr:hypothetical protein KSS87_002994 [Heliosperma pusillum]
MYSWLRKSFTRINKEDTHKLQTPKSLQISFSKLEQEQYHGVTDHLIEFIKTLTFDSFKNFSLPEEQSDAIQPTPTGIMVDLSEWQQQHATLILSKVKIRMQSIYYPEVSPFNARYELRAIRHDKLRRMATEAEKPSDINGIELEMTEPKHMRQLPSP